MGCASSTPAATPNEFHDEYVLGKRLGRGSFAQVRIASPAYRKSGRGIGDRAVKILDLRDADNPDKTSPTYLKEAHDEAKVWLAVKYHANVVQLHELFYDPTFCYFVMEKCEGCILQHFDSMLELDERSIGLIFSQMLLAISHVHTVGVVHRDIKPDNFLVGAEQDLTVKLSDFGLSAFLPRNRKLKGVFGTAPYMCPEMLKRKDYDEKADVWSMGVLAYTLFFGGFPYVPEVKNSKLMKEAIVEGKPPSFQPRAPGTEQLCSPPAVAFAKTLLKRNPDERPSAGDALKLPFMAAVSEGKHMTGSQLPSLRPMLYAAKKAGAFETRDLRRKVEGDDLLETLQKSRWGEAMVDSQAPHDSNGTSQNKSSISAINETSEHSNIWSNASSLATGASGNTCKSPDHSKHSNILSNTSSLRTAASGTTRKSLCPTISSNDSSSVASPMSPRSVDGSQIYAVHPRC